MNSQFSNSLIAWTGTFPWTLAWQSTLWLALGLVAARVWRGRAARSHLLLILATVAAFASPMLTAAVRQMGWGVLPAPPAIESVVRDFDPTPISAANSSSLEGPEFPVEQAMPPFEDPSANDSAATKVAPPSAMLGEAAPAPTVQQQPTNSWTARFSKARVGDRLPAAAVGAWLVCSLVLFLRLATSLLAGRRLVRRLAAETHPQLVAALREAAQLLGVRGDLRLSTSPAARCPMIWCWGRQPILLVPPAAGDQRGVSWCSIFCHELAHWLRRDHLSALWTELLVIAIPWQPLAWLSRRQLSALREQACDDWVLASIREATDYAESLVNLVPQNSPTFALPALRSYESLKRRLKHVLAGVRVTPRAGRNWIALASLVSLVAAAGIAFAQQRSATARTVAETSANAISGDQTSEIKLLPAKEELDDLFTVRGQVLKPNGEPAVGARVSMRRQYRTSSVKWRPYAVATAGATGRFELSCHPSQFIDDLGTRLRHATVAAQADGFGAQWTELQTVDPLKPLVLKLVPEFPIQGRVVNLEGKPVEGVRVRLHQIRGPKVGDNLGPWLDAVKLGAMTNGLSAKLGTILPGIEDDSEPPILTDRDGHFTFRGIGAERDVRFELWGETIASRQFNVATREMQPLKRNLWFSLTDQVFGASFTLQAGPTKPIVGTVRDRATGKPLPGVRVQSEGLAGMLYYPHDGVQTKTDAEGKFRLVGMPKQNPGGPDAGSRNVIGIIPNEDQPYFIRKIAVPDTPGLEPVRLDVDLRRGQWVMGRVTDKMTGKPVVSRVEYFPFVKNPYATLPEFDRNRGDLSRDERFHTRPDGTYRLLALAGRAIVGVTAASGLYRTGVGASAIADLVDGAGFQKYMNDPSPRILSALKEINPAEGAQTANCDFVLDPGGTIHIRLVDRAGQPVSGVSLLGESGAGEGMLGMSTGPTFDVINLAPHEKRTIEIYHRERQIGKHLVFSFDEKTPRTMTVTVEPCATLVGRLVDADGVAVPGIEIHASPAPGSWPWLFTPIETTRTDGRFECHGLYPGCKYDLAVALSHGITIDVQFLRSGIEIEPGKVINFGDVKLKRGPTDAAASEPPSGKSAKGKSVAASGRIAPSSGAAQRASEINPLPSKEENGDVLTIRGQVRSQDARPMAGVKVSIVTFVDDANQQQNGAGGQDVRRLNRFTRIGSRRCVPLAVTRSRSDGMFEIVYRKSQFASGNNWQYAPVVAEAEGFGVNEWMAWARIDALKPVVLQLAPDVPVKGRVVDLEGKPVAGVRIENVHVSAPSRGENLEPWIEALKMGRDLGSTSQLVAKSVPWYRMESQGQLMTDSDGRFQLNGIGRERVVGFHLRGETIVYADLTVATRKMEPLTHPLGLYSSDEKTPLMRQVYGSEFTFQATPTQPIMGTVRDTATGKPLAGVGIASDLPLPGMMAGDVLRTETDAEGRYRLVGLPKASHDTHRGQIRLSVVPNVDQPYFLRRVEVPLTAGLTPVTVDVALHRGTWIEGRVVDKATQQGLSAYVDYRPLLSNRFVQGLPEFGPNDDVEGDYFHYAYSTRPDGTFRLPGVPGPAILGASEMDGPRAVQAKRGSFRRGVGASEIMARNEEGNYLAYATFGSANDRRYNVVHAINPPEGAPSFRCDFAFERGDSIRVALVDSTGKPVDVSDCFIVGDTNGGRRRLPRGSSFEVSNLVPDEPRSLVIYHLKRNIGVIRRLKYDAKSPKTIAVTLEPCGTIKGRLVDEEGVALRNLQIEPSPRPFLGRGWNGSPLGPLNCGPDGRFEYAGLLPGCDHYIFEVYGPEIARTTIGKVAIEAGKTIDLGEIKVKRGPGSRSMEINPIDLQVRNATGGSENHATTTGEFLRVSAVARPEGRSAGAEKALRYSGRVVEPDGKPAAGAQVFFSRSSAPKDVELKATTAASGAFEFTVPADVLFGKRWLRIIAVKPGFGLAWVPAEELKTTSDLQLRLVADDLPVEGRILNLEGRPVVGATVRVTGIDTFANDNPQPYLELIKTDEMKASNFQFPSWLREIPQALSARTDERGRFRLVGIGRHRHALLMISGNAIADTPIQVLTDPVEGTFNAPQTKYFADPVHGPQFTHHVRPSRPIVGTVTDAKTGRPLAGARVSQLGGVSRAVTDASGRFELQGCAKADEYRLYASAPQGQSTYFTGSLTARDRPGLEPIDVQLHLYPAIPLAGRVIDAVTGKPVPAEVSYWPVARNAYVVKEMAGTAIRASGPFSTSFTKPDGSFALGVLPGPGALVVSIPGKGEFEPAHVDAAKFFRQQGVRYDSDRGEGQAQDYLMIAVAKDAIAATPQSQFQGIALLNVPETAKQLTQNIDVRSKAKGQTR